MTPISSGSLELEGVFLFILGLSTFSLVGFINI